MQPSPDSMSINFVMFSYLLKYLYTMHAKYAITIFKEIKNMSQTKEFVEVLKKVSKTTSKDATRYNLCGVFVQRLENGYVQFQASDGHCYSNRTEHLPEVNEIMKTKGHYWFHRDIIKEMKITGYIPPVISAQGEELSIVSASGVQYRSESMDNRPDFEHIEPRKLIDGEADHVEVAFNPDLLTYVRDALARGKKGSPGITVRIPIKRNDDNTIEPTLGAYVAVSDGSIGLIMPMRK